jgi:translation initiation factor IF-2
MWLSNWNRDGRRPGRRRRPRPEGSPAPGAGRPTRRHRTARRGPASRSAAPRTGAGPGGGGPRPGSGPPLRPPTGGAVDQGPGRPVPGRSAATGATFAPKCPASTSRSTKGGARPTGRGPGWWQVVARPGLLGGAVAALVEGPPPAARPRRAGTRPRPRCGRWRRARAAAPPPARSRSSRGRAGGHRRRARRGRRGWSCWSAWAAHRTGALRAPPRHSSGGVSQLPLELLAVDQLDLGDLPGARLQPEQRAGAELGEPVDQTGLERTGDQVAVAD